MYTLLFYQIEPWKNGIISKIPHRISKIIFALCADEFLEMLEGKIRATPFFKGSIW